MFDWAYWLMFIWVGDFGSCVVAGHIDLCFSVFCCQLLYSCLGLLLVLVLVAGSVCVWFDADYCG